MANAGTDLLIQHLRTVLSPRHETETDGELLTRWVAARDAQAFAALVRRHGAMVWRAARSVLHEPHDAEDVFQATFFVLARKAAGLQGRTSVAGWLFQTAHRLALKARTATARRLRREACCRTPAIDRADPLDEISVREAQAVLADEMDRLPVRYREPFLLCVYEGVTQDEAARHLGCSVSTLKRRLDRGRAILGQRLARRGLVLSGVLGLALVSRSQAPAQAVLETVAAAGSFADGRGLTGPSADLANRMLRSLLVKKLLLDLTVVLTLGGLVLATAMTGSPDVPAPPAAVPPPKPPALVREPAARLDPHGDPLPPGAVNRIGSLRFRHAGDVTGVLYTPDGRAIVSMCWDGFLRLWDARTGNLRWRLQLERGSYQAALAIAPDFRSVAVLQQFDYARVAADTGKTLARHTWPREKGQNAVSCLAVSPDLRTLARGCFDATVRLYDADDGGEKLRITVGDRANSQFPRAVEFGADGKTVLVTTNQGQTVTAYDTTSGKRIRTLRVDGGSAYRLALSPDGRLLAAMGRGNPPGANDRVMIWDLAAGKSLHVVEQLFPDPLCAAFSPDGTRLAVGSQGRDIVVFDTATGKEMRRLHWHPSTLTLVFAPDGKTLASGDSAGTIAVWDVAAGKLVPPSPDPGGSLYNLRFVDGGRHLLSVADGVYWWDVKTARLVRHLPSDPAWSFSTEVSPDGKLVAAALGKGDIRLVDADTGQTVRTLSEHKQVPFRMAFSPDGTRLFSAGGFDPRVIIWDVATGKPLHRLESHGRFVDHVAVAPNGRRLASWAADAAAQGDYDIRLWDPATGKLIYRLTPPRGSAFAMAFSPDSSQLVSVGGDPGRLNDRGEVQLWDVATGKGLRSFPGHRERVTCVAFSPDGRTFVTGSLDLTLRLWEVASGAERCRIAGHEAYVHSVAFSPDGKFLAAASEDAPVFIWDVYHLPVAKSAPWDGTQLWQALGDIDTARAFQAVCALVARRDEAVSVLRDGWKRTPRATAAEMQQWLKDLDSGEFAVRRRAVADLDRFAAAHEDLLRQALERAPSLEVRRRLAEILERPNGERLRRGRMLEVLEQLGTAPAQQFLRTLAADTEDTALAQQAAASLRRLEARKR